MTTFQRILCPIDYSEYSRRALDHAVAIAHWYGGTVKALHVLQPLPYTDPIVGLASVYTPEDVEQAQRHLSQFVHDEVGSTPVEAVVVEGHVSRTIVREARAMSADLLVLGTHGHTGFEHLLLGSVTERVLRTATCPVMTVPRQAPDVVEAGPVVFGRILCAVDFSPVSSKILNYAESLARESGAHLTVIHVVEPIPVYGVVIAGTTGVGTYEQVALDATKTRLHEMVPRGGRISELVSVGKPYRVILDYARDEHSDAIVLGVHGGGADRLGFFGSTTNHIVREATCPVLSLRG